MASRKTVYNNESAVSVLIGTLALIAVVVMGTIGIATILGTFSTDVAKQTSSSKSVEATKTPVYISGSDNMDLLTRSLGDSYTESNPSVRIVSAKISPDVVYPAIVSKRTDIGALAGTITYNDIVKNPDMETRQIGMSAVVLITNKTGPYRSVSPSYNDIKYLFTSGIPGSGPLAGAIPVIRSDKSGTADTFYNDFLGIPTPTSLGYGDEEDSDTALISHVQESLTGIGFADYGEVKSAIENGVQISILTIQDDFWTYTSSDYSDLNMAAKSKYLSTQRHADGSFVWTGNQADVSQYNLTLIYPLYYVTKDNPSTLQTGFIDYAASPAARTAFKQAYAFSLADF